MLINSSQYSLIFNIDIKKIEFSSKNNFSFNDIKNLKFDNLKLVLGSLKPTNF